jgi:hypothetical protein
MPAVRGADSVHTTATPKALLAVARRGSAAVHVRACCLIRPQDGAHVKPMLVTAHHNVYLLAVIKVHFDVGCYFTRSH